MMKNGGGAAALWRRKGRVRVGARLRLDGQGIPSATTMSHVWRPGWASDGRSEQVPAPRLL